MSDSSRLTLETLIPTLSHYSLIILRDYHHPHREDYAKSMLSQCHQHGHLCFIAADAPLATKLNADGLHVPRWYQPPPYVYQLSRTSLPLSCSTHNIAEIRRANRLNAALSILSPLKPTHSHKNTKSLGTFRFMALATQLRMPCYAMGGLGLRQKLPKPIQKHCTGIAAISAFE